MASSWAGPLSFSGMTLVISVELAIEFRREDMGEKLAASRVMRMLYVCFVLAIVK